MGSIASRLPGERWGGREDLKKSRLGEEGRGREGGGRGVSGERERRERREGRREGMVRKIRTGVVWEREGRRHASQQVYLS